MARELEPRDDVTPGSVAPLYGPGGGFPVVPSGTFEHKPDWMEVGTPRTPGDGFRARADQVWFYISYAPRWLAIAFLAVTFRWYYVAGLAVTVGFLIYLLTSTP